MASRQLRKLRKQQELQGQFELDKKTAAEEESSEDEPVVAKPRTNLFAGFAALGDQGEDDDDDEQNSHDEEAKSNEPGPVMEDGANNPAKKNKKKKNKKKKGKKSDVSSTPGQAPAATEQLDDIDKALKELKIEKPESLSTGHSAADPDVQIADHFHINFQHLKANNELRRMFGRTDHLVEMEEQAQQTRTRNRNADLEEFLSAPLDPRQGRASGMSEILIRSNPFIEGKKTWPRDSAHGLKMEQKQEGTFGLITFAYAHDANYQELEKNFVQLVGMGDPMQLIHFLRRYPYHISTLIQVSRYARDSDQNNALAVDLIERALFNFGRVTLTGFRKKLEHGKARVDFLLHENRQLYLAGYNHIRNLQQKGTVRTALEWTKLLFSLDPKDPYGLINFLHPLAIHANEAKWFVDLATTTPLLDYKLPTGWYIKQTLVLAYLQLRNQDLAREALLSGINKLPWLYCSIFSALNLDTPKCVWGIKPRDERDEFNTALYLHMTKDLWDNPNTISFLKSVASAAPTNKDYMNLPPSPSPDLATERFIYLDNTPALLSALPSSSMIRSGAMVSYDYDPLPPPNSRTSAAADGGPGPTAYEAREATAREAMAAAARLLTGDSEASRQSRRAVLDGFLEAAQAGATDMEDRFESLADLTRDVPDWIVRFRADFESEMNERRAGNNNNNNEGAAARGGRPFQATVEDAADDDDDVLPPSNQDQNQEAGEGVSYSLLRRVFGLFSGSGQSAGEDTVATDTQGLPEPVYRALEDLALPDMPGGWGAHDGDETPPWESDADYSAITGRRAGDGGHEDGDGARRG